MLDLRLLTAVLLAGAVVFLVIRRVRRSFGRQPIEPGRLRARAMLIAAAGVLTGIGALHDPPAITALAGGVIGGAILGTFAVKYTRFEVTDRGRFYTPHVTIGTAVLAVFLGRLVYRLVGTYAIAQGALPSPAAAASANRSPVTLGICGLLVGYYLLFNLGVVRSAARLPAP